MESRYQPLPLALWGETTLLKFEKQSEIKVADDLCPDATEICNIEGDTTNDVENLVE